MSYEDDEPPMPPLDISILPILDTQENYNDLVVQGVDASSVLVVNNTVQVTGIDTVTDCVASPTLTQPSQINMSIQIPGTLAHSSAENHPTTFDKIPPNGIVLPREKNKIFVDLLRYDLNIDQLSYYKDIINTHRAKQYHILESESQKVNFTIALMRDHFEHKRVFKYNELLDVFTELNRKSLYLNVREKLINIKSYQKCIESKSKRSRTSSVSGTGTKLEESVVQSRSFSLVAYSRSHPYSTFYKSINELHHMEEWHYYSMFHSLYQSFSIVVYNYSHRLADTELVHRCTRLKINFPPNANAILFIHGRLVHSGSASKSENNLSYNHSHDLRLFLILIKNLQRHRSSIDDTSSSSRRSSNRQQVDSLYHNHTADGEVDRRTFCMCNSTCKTCVSISGTKELNVEDIYKDKNLRVGWTSRTKAPKKIIGDINKFGWVIYTGVNIHHKDYVYHLDEELSNLVKNKPRRMWHGIGGTERRYFKLDEFMIEDTSKALKETENVSKIFDDIHSLVVHKIPIFKDKVVIKKKSLLANFGVVKEQQPHRDFGCSRVDDNNSMN